VTGAVTGAGTGAVTGVGTGEVTKANGQEGPPPLVPIGRAVRGGAGPVPPLGRLDGDSSSSYSIIPYIIYNRN
jgi:hypothetical protein